MIDQTISHYKILEKLGEGGMGVVYKARDTKLDRDVALKFLPSNVSADSSEKQRFILEAKAASALQHNNICTVHDIDETLDSQLFIVMDCYEGETLKEKLSHGPLDVSEAVNIAIQIAEGLKKAHEKGIVHRDIKPANIFITTDGVAKILDFGLVKLTGQTKLTKTISTLGTIAYMSPEQTKGQNIDHRTDIWSFGVVLYEMLTGYLPFKGDYEQAVIYSILNEPPGLFSPEIPDSIAEIVSRCLNKSMNDRYQTIKVVKKDLENVQNNLNVTISHLRNFTPESIFTKHKRTLLLVVPLIVAAFISLFLLRSFLSQNQTGQSTKEIIAVLPFQNLGSAEYEYFADALTGEIISRLSTLQGLGVIARQSIVEYKGTSKSPQEIVDELKVGYLLTGTVFWQSDNSRSKRVRITPELIKVNDNTQLWSENFDAELAADIFGVQSEISEQIARILDIKLIPKELKAIQNRPTDNLEAYQAYQKGIIMSWHGSFLRADLEKTVGLFEKAINLDSNFALAYAALCRAHMNMYHWGYDRTNKRLLMAKEAVDRAFELEPELPEAYLALGWYYYQGYRNFESALTALTKAGTFLPNDVNIPFAIGVIRKRQGRFNEAIDKYKEALQLNPRDVRLFIEIAVSERELGNYDKCIESLNLIAEFEPNNPDMFREIIYTNWLKGDLMKADMYIENMPPEMQDFIVFASFQQELYKRNYKAALDHLTSKVMNFVERQEWFYPISLLQARVFNILGNSERAQACFDSARVFLENRLKSQPDDFRIKSSLGLAYAGLGRNDDAVRQAKRCLELYPVSKYIFWGKECIKYSAQIYTAVGDYDEALELIDSLLSSGGHLLSIQLLQLDPQWDVLRNHPMYKQILMKYSQ